MEIYFVPRDFFLKAAGQMRKGKKEQEEEVVEKEQKEEGKQKVKENQKKQENENEKKKQKEKEKKKEKEKEKGMIRIKRKEVEEKVFSITYNLEKQCPIFLISIFSSNLMYIYAWNKEECKTTGGARTTTINKQID